MNMKSYNEIFEKSKTEFSQLNVDKLFLSFRDNPGPYHFLTAVGKQRFFPDVEALDIAKKINLDLANAYINIPKPKIGYSNEDSYVPIDAIDSRHIMMSTFIVHHLGKKIDSIIEIGGGFGNWARINSEIIDFKTWEIIDLDFVLPLQKWFLTNTINSIDKLIFLDAFEKKEPKFRDLCIAAHSLSEMALDIFKNYLNDVLLNSNFIFYATHKSLPSKELVDIKLELLSENFSIVDTVESEKGKVLNILYKNKKYE